jgi:polyphosphate kinase 2 (PPK2 family)
MAGCHVGCMPTWTIVESKDKYYARIKIMEIVIKALQDAISCTGKKNRKNA